jgi:hypothetical protein
MQGQIWMPWKPFCADFVKHFPNLYVQEEKKAETPRSCSKPVEPGNFPLDPAENWLNSKMVLSENGTPRSIPKAVMQKEMKHCSQIQFPEIDLR